MLRYWGNLGCRTTQRRPLVSEATERVTSTLTSGKYPILSEKPSILTRLNWSCKLLMAVLAFAVLVWPLDGVGENTHPPMVPCLRLNHVPWSFMACTRLSPRDSSTASGGPRNMDFKVHHLSVSRRRVWQVSSAATRALEIGV